ncbi:hypothetical protein CXB51_001807 [Gossypium anomalum]|uniref:Retrotransposon gag domain-containing protein n=1 Tax=Gossypium anomalum TaxID=47600 RepID=A0A8J6DF44_9ROSI|nr:hypothetical protein CXB51_001807 [Gossypium anomalum]
MTRRNPSGPLLFDSEIESIAHRNRIEIRRSLQYIEEEREEDIHTTTEEMADNQKNLLPPVVAANPIDLETLYDAWERYKDLLRRCPNHGLPLWLQVQTFYNGVNPSTRQLIDATAVGTLNNKTPEEAYEFIEEMSLKNYQWQVMRMKPTKAAGVFNLNAVTMLSNQVELLNKKIDGWRNHPNFSWGGQGNQRPQHPSSFQQPPYQQEKKPNLEEMFTKFISVSETHFQNIKTALTNQQASIQGLEIQIGQLAKLISERPQGGLPSNTETNPREQLHAITVHNDEGLVEAEPKPRQDNVEDKGKVDVSNSTQKPIPNAVKFLKEILANKRKLDDASYVELNAVCSAILQKRLPNKLKDPGSFTIPCLIGSLNIKNALAYLGASINVMPYKMFKQLGLRKPKQTRMSIQLADKTIRFPKGIIEEVIVKIDKFIFPVDFVVLDMDEDRDNTITLQARDSIKLSSKQDGYTSSVDINNIMAQASFWETLRKNVMETHSSPCDKNRTSHKALQIDELDEWSTHVKEKPKAHDESKQHHDKRRDETTNSDPHGLDTRACLRPCGNRAKSPQVLSHTVINLIHTVM